MRGVRGLLASVAAPGETPVGRVEWGMAPAPPPSLPLPTTTAPSRPALTDIFMLFLRIGAVSFGGGMSAWIRREVVLKKGWLEDRQFLAGLALCQITPGANGVNIAIFTGSLLRGGAGACAAFAGLMAIPFFALLGAGAFYFANQGAIRSAGLGTALAGVAAAAIGLMMANGIRLSRRNLRSWPQAGITLATALSIGWFRLPLLEVLVLIAPASLAIAWWQRQK